MTSLDLIVPFASTGAYFVATPRICGTTKGGIFVEVKRSISRLENPASSSRVPVSRFVWQPSKT